MEACQMNRVSLFALTSIAVAGFGCSQQVGPVGEVIEVVDASGVLTFQGKPLEGFTVTFMPVTGGRPASGITDAAGKFVLGTNGANDGAVAGFNNVAVVWTGPPATDDTTAGPIDDPADMPAPPVEIPAKYANPDTSGITVEVPRSGASDLKIELE
jgi:hypothetical protein